MTRIDNFVSNFFLIYLSSFRAFSSTQYCFIAGPKSAELVKHLNNIEVTCCVCDLRTFYYQIMPRIGYMCVWHYVVQFIIHIPSFDQSIQPSRYDEELVSVAPLYIDNYNLFITRISRTVSGQARQFLLYSFQKWLLSAKLCLSCGLTSATLAHHCVFLFPDRPDNFSYTVLRSGYCPPSSVSVVG